jgi:hypothetical protein
MHRRRLVSLGVFVASLTAIGLMVSPGGPGAQAASSHQVIPTVIVQTAVPTARPTATATATATGIPLAAIPVGVASLEAHRHGNVVTFAWRMLGQEQVRGFRLYAGKTRMNHGLIPVHASLVYQRHVRWSGHGQFGLGVVFTDGQQIRVEVR